MTKKLNGYNYFFLAILAFLTLGMDLFIIPIDTLIYGDLFNIDNFFLSPWYVLVTHWFIVVSIWIIGIIFLFRYLKRKDVLSEVVSVKKGENLIYFLLAAAVLSILFSVIESLVFNDSLPQFYTEYKSFYNVHDKMAWLVSVFQNIYYVVESILVVLLLALMQKAGEEWYSNKLVPYGGLGLLFTWGISHLTKGITTGLWISAFSLVLGLLFIKADKRWWPSILFVWLLFFI